MLNALVNMVFWLIFSVARAFVSIVSLPVYNLLVSIFPNLDSFMIGVNDFLDDYFFQGLQFAREVFINTTCIPHDLFTAIVTLFFGFIVIGFSITPILFILNSINNVRKGVLTK